MDFKLFTIIFVLFHSAVFAQNTEVVRCGLLEGEVLNELELRKFEEWMNKEKVQLSARDNEVLRIPVVFHVIHSGSSIGEGVNLSANQIAAQLEQVNNDLRKKEGTSGDNEFLQGADIGIELVPAIYDENLNEMLEPGINRVSAASLGITNGTYSKYYVNNIIKPATQWNPNFYLNIWICDLAGGLLGFAQFPEIEGLEGVDYDTPVSQDGITVLYKTVGSTEMPNELANGAFANYNKGRTLTHELGHALGLRHIWGDGNCGVDDYCSDTPSSDGANYGCPSSHNSCGSKDMVENYMDYTYDLCMNVFTEEQRVRMRMVLLNAPRRLELLVSDRAIDASISLPVELIGFDVSIEDNKGKIGWETIAEINNSHFVVLKSVDGKLFKQIGIVEGEGTYAGNVQYEYIDEELSLGENYYQLIQVDIDGTEIDLGIQMVNFSTKRMSFNVYPNPVQIEAVLDFKMDSVEEVDIQIYDSQGRMFERQTRAFQEGELLYLDCKAFNPGIYFVKIRANGFEITRKLYKM